MAHPYVGSLPSVSIWLAKDKMWETVAKAPNFALNFDTRTDGSFRARLVPQRALPYRVRDRVASGESLHPLGRCAVEGLLVDRYLDDTEQSLSLSHPHEGTCESLDFHAGGCGRVTLGGQLMLILRLASFCQVQPKAQACT